MFEEESKQTRRQQGYHAVDLQKKRLRNRLHRLFSRHCAMKFTLIAVRQSDVFRKMVSERHRLLKLRLKYFEKENS